MIVYARGHHDPATRRCHLHAEPVKGTTIEVEDHRTNAIRSDTNSSVERRCGSDASWIKADEQAKQKALAEIAPLRAQWLSAARKGW